jgi:hypothetical protein
MITHTQLLRRGIIQRNTRTARILIILSRYFPFGIYSARIGTNTTDFLQLTWR